MSLTVSFKNNQWSLVKNGTATAVSPEQATAWKQKLDSLAQQHGLKDATDLLKQGTVVVPEEGDSQWRIAEDFGVAPTDIANTVVPLNTQFSNPDLIHTYHAGDTNPDFVMLPLPPDADSTGDTPDATQPPTSIDAKASPSDASKAILAQPDPAKQKAMVDGYLGAQPADKQDQAAIDLASYDYGKQSDAVRQMIFTSRVDLIKNPDTDKQKTDRKDALDRLAKHNYTPQVHVPEAPKTDPKFDTMVDSSILHAATALGYKREDLPDLNKDAK
jgi:hypothetical protein